jgi:splicing factor U2AF 65 kDa subunit
VKPPDGVELPPVGVHTTINGVPNSYLSFTNDPLALAGSILGDSSNTTNNGHGGGNHHLSSSTTSGGNNQDQSLTVFSKVDTSVHSRHARRIYAGGVPATVTEQEIVDYFNRILIRLVHPKRFVNQPVLKAYLNLDKAFAFVEFTSIELASACMALDGIRFDHRTGPCLLRIRRPNDYRPELVPPNLGSLPEFNHEVMAELGASIPGGPGKLFVGGVPHHLAEEQIMELLQAFGPLKSFHLVREPGMQTSKGYCFCEYQTQDAAALAITGLNEMPIGDRRLTVRFAAQNAAGGTTQMMGLAITTGGPLAIEYGNMTGEVGGGGVGGMSGGNNNTMVMNPAGPGFGYDSMTFQTTYNPHAALLNTVPTRILKLSNMVTHHELQNDAEYQDILEDVRLECAEYGQVLNVVIPRGKDGFPVTAEGHIYVEFIQTDQATTAAFALNGRKFSDRTVMVQYVSVSIVMIIITFLKYANF